MSYNVETNFMAISFFLHRIHLLQEQVTMMDWIWDVCWLKSSEGYYTTLALALGHNIIIRWNWTNNHIMDVVRCEEKCILYPYANFRRNRNKSAFYTKLISIQI